jgi:ubiquinone/menaquinone biosynthesis C-methylase UbiE
MNQRGPNRWFFDAWSHVYDWPIVQRATYRPLHDAVIGALEPFKGRRVLDVGCGTGQLTARLHDSHKRATIVGCDFSAGMLQQAHARDRTITWICGNACELPFRDGVFAALVCTEAFHWFPDQNAALAEFFRILSPGGRLMIAFVNTRLRFTSEITRVASGWLGEPLYWPTIDQMRQQVENAGFRVIGQKRVLRIPGLLFPPVLTTALKPQHAVAA